MADDKAETTAQVEFGPMGGRDKVHMTLRDTTANPGPLGLMAFGMTTLLLNIHNAGIYEMSTMILAMGVFYGGIAQVSALMFVATLRINRLLQVTFSTLVILFVLLAFRDWAGGAASAETFLGVSG